ncbi:MAG: radical SAM protein [Verrucomicrobiota bacterium]
MESLEVCEIFTSMQGETSYAGRTCFFIRLTGCNLDCRYCDTQGARQPGTETKLDDLIRMAVSGRHSMIMITGGEPLLQPGCCKLAETLRSSTDIPVVMETNGSMDISVIPEGVTAAMDIKCPGSRMSEKMDWANIGRLREYDEVKFVIGDRKDYEWAVEVTCTQKLVSRCGSVFMTPVWGELEYRTLAEWIIKDGHDVRLGMQLHKIAGIR